MVHEIPWPLWSRYPGKYPLDTWDNVHGIGWTLSSRYPGRCGLRYPDMHLWKRLTYPVECRWIDACARSNCSGCFEIWIRFPPFVRSYHRPPRRRFLLPLFSSMFVFVSFGSFKTLTPSHCSCCCTLSSLVVLRSISPLVLHLTAAP
jgi:hypothetical protein